MSKALYVGIAAKARKVKKIYLGIANKARKVKKNYNGIGNVAKDSSVFGLPSFVTISSSSLTYPTTDFSYWGCSPANNKLIVWSRHEPNNNNINTKRGITPYSSTLSAGTPYGDTSAGYYGINGSQIHYIPGSHSVWISGEDQTEGSSYWRVYYYGNCGAANSSGVLSNFSGISATDIAVNNTDSTLVMVGGIKYTVTSSKYYYTGQKYAKAVNTSLTVSSLTCNDNNKGCEHAASNNKHAIVFGGQNETKYGELSWSWGSVYAYNSTGTATYLTTSPSKTYVDGNVGAPSWTTSNFTPHCDTYAFGSYKRYDSDTVQVYFWNQSLSATNWTFNSAYGASILSGYPSMSVLTINSNYNTVKERYTVNSNLVKALYEGSETPSGLSGYYKLTGIDSRYRYGVSGSKVCRISVS